MAIYTWHAWIVLQTSAYENDDAELVAKVEGLRRLVRSSNLLSDDVDPIFVTNGEMVFHESRRHNRRGRAHDELLAILEWIVRELPGSYGLVYWEDEQSNGFRVAVIARGTITDRPDPFLSPRVPVIEEPEPE